MANGDQYPQYDFDFFDIITKGNWDDVVDTCRKYPSTIGLPLTKTEDNVIHLAVSRGETGRLAELIGISKEETMELRTNKEGDTPLNLAAMRGDRVMCVLLCKNGKTALTIRNNRGEAPMYLASVKGEMGTFTFLLGVFTELHSVAVPLVNWDQLERNDQEACKKACIRGDDDTILHAAIRGEFIDLAYKIFYHFRHFAIIENNEGETPIHLLAKLPSSFMSGYRPGIFERLVDHLGGFFVWKSVIKEKRKHILSCTMVEKTIQYLKMRPGINQSNPWMRSENAATNSSEVTVANTLEGANPPGNTASNSNTSQQASSNPSEEKKTNIDAPIVSAVKMGITEMVSMILESFPSTVEEVDGNGKNLVFVAAESRQPQVLQLLMKLNIRQTLVTERLKDGKNVLHVAAELQEDHNPWSIISGTAPLQMHLEAKWFELVKSLMPSHLQLYKNNDGKKPNEVFEKTHEKLVGEGLEWLSSTARSCTVVSSLLTTAALATAATVPGGVDEHGVPHLRDNWRFKVFTISALMTLCFGVLSLVLSLVILSSRSGVKNFNVGLPRKLIYGLTTLYCSLGTLLLAFCSAQSFAMHGRVRDAAYASYAMLALSIIFLVIEQLPLFFDFIEITFAKIQNWSNS